MPPGIVAMCASAAGTAWRAPPVAPATDGNAMVTPIRRVMRRIVVTFSGISCLLVADGHALHRGEDLLVVLPVYGDHSQRSLVESAEDRVVHEDQLARPLRRELDDGRSARGDERGLDVVLDVRAAFGVYVVEDFPDHVEG